MDDRVWDASTFSHNRERLLAGEVAQEFLAALVSLPEVKASMSREHFSVDATLIDAYGAASKLGRVRRTALDGRTLRHASYDARQRRRKTIEEVFGWAKVTAGLGRVKVRGLARVDAAFAMVAAAYNLRRLANIAAAATR